MRSLKFLFFLILFVAVPIFFSCSHNGKLPSDCEVPFEKTTFSFDQGTYPSDLNLFLEYRISPGDVLDVFYQIMRIQKKDLQIDLYHTIAIKFVDIPDLNEEQEVLPDGTIVLPYVGQISVVGKTIEELTQELKNKYSGVLRDPELYVTIPNFYARIEQLRHDLHTAPRGLSKLITVRPDGHVTFPMIGDHMVANKTIKQVIEMIQKDYNDFLPGMKVDVFLHSQTGSVIYVLGEVMRPGTYEILRPINCIEAITIAGGYTFKAELRNVIAFRKHEKRIVARSLNLKDLLNLKDQSPFFYLGPDDILFIPKTRIASLAELMGQIRDIALFDGWTVGINEGVNFIHTKGE